MLRILQVIGFASTGGAERNTYLLTRVLAKQGHTCFLVTPSGDFSPHFADLRELGVTYVIMDFRKEPIKTLRRLRALVREQNIDLVHSHMYLADFMVMLATWRIRGLIRISTLHISIRNQFFVSRWRRMQQKLCSMLAFKGFDKVFAVSESMRSEAIKYFHLPPEKVVTSLNSIDFSKMGVDDAAKSALAAKYGLGRPAFRIGCVGKFHPLKSQITLIQAVGKHLRDSRDIEVYLIGDGETRGELAEEAKHLGLDGRIHLVGHQEAMNEWYSHLDMFVHTSYTEALSRSILEAMYMRLPIVASDIPSTREVLRHGESALLFPPGDALKLAESILAFRSDAQLAARCVEKARSFVTENCSMDGMAKIILANLPGRGEKS